MTDKRGLLEPVLGVLDELSEVDHQAPGEWAVHVESLEQDLADLLLDLRLGVLGFLEQVEQLLAELVCVRVWIAQLVDDAVQEGAAGLFVELDRNLLDQIEALFHAVAHLSVALHGVPFL